MPNFIPKAKIGMENNLFRVAELKNTTGDGWNEQLVLETFDQESAAAILTMEWPKDRCVDKLMWLRNDGDGFSVRSSYRSLFDAADGSMEMSKWNRLWKLKLHDRLKLFL